MRRATGALPLWVKLSPNTGDVAAVARAVEDAGADAIVVANTILGLAIDIETARPKLGSGMGGFSGPGFKPIALRLVWQCAQAVRIPVIGVGGIATAEDAVEFLMAGAAAVQVGTASFVSPTAMLQVIEDLEGFCARKGIARAADLTGAALPRPLREAAE
jgi:dihydroorotate dehydrogenase (NAD+) catalytic subunit